ncbi:MAG: beta-lactamase family protein [Candidatus Obscuribacterales bacterium]|nr:beta-lactamase family protein [Steroidobacteraceae bacterium]
MSIRPESLGFSSARLKNIDRFLQQRYLDNGKLPCTQTLIARRGEIIYQSVLGQMDVERKRPATEDTIYRIYSMTKPITSVAFMMLVEEGLVSLDEPVHRVIPEWRDLGVYASGAHGMFRTERTQQPMRMVDLLRHTSGLTYGFQLRTNVDAAYRKLKIGEFVDGLSLDDMIKTLATLPLEFSPGTAWNYGVSTDVLGYLVGKISGQPFEQFVRERILKPLKMADTDFSVPATKASRFAACYAATSDLRMTLQDDPTTSPYLQPPTFVSGGAGLVSTAADYLRFAQMLLNGGELDGVRLISPKTLHLMTSNHLPGNKELPELSRSLFSEAMYNGVGFGLGFAVTVNSARTLILGSTGEFTWGGMASTLFWVDPREQLVGIFLTQLTPSSTYAVRRDLRTLTYAAMTESYA